MRAKRSIFEDIDWLLVGLYCLLCILGWVNIYAATYNEEHYLITDLSQSYGKQMIWVILGLILALIIMFLEPRFFEAFSGPIYIFGMALLMGVLIFGTEIKGAKSWFTFGSFSLQPSEFAKYATALYLSKYLSGVDKPFASLRGKMRAIFILVIPAFLIMLQPDAGSTLVYLAFFLVLYREGLNRWLFIFGILAAILFVLALVLKQFEWAITETFTIGGKTVFFVGLSLMAVGVYYLLRKWKGSALVVFGSAISIMSYYLSVDYLFSKVLQPHHQNRINELLGIISDPRGVGYNVHQSKIAIGSGGFTGKGFLQGTQTKFNFVPEQSTDFIFCTVGEEWGFIGSALIVMLFTFLIIRIFWMAERQKSQFTRIYGYCVASIFLLHFSINIGMTIGLAPVIGIPLPFFSYGGSSLWAFTILLFTFIKLDSDKRFVLR